MSRQGDFKIILRFMDDKGILSVNPSDTEERKQVFSKMVLRDAERHRGDDLLNTVVIFVVFTYKSILVTLQHYS